MIPKRIHYCWFGRGQKPELAEKCIESWRKYLPDYELKEWNEDNFDVNIIPYTKQAYEAKKYAFVSDYARFWILYHFGGIYFDTDVEVIRPMDDIIARGAFMGLEKGAFHRNRPMVAPGLGLGVEAGHSFYRLMLSVYEGMTFLNADGIQKPGTVVSITTEVLYNEGMIPTEELQNFSGIWIYPTEFFCPLDSTIGIISITDNTVSIHHYGASWIDHTTFRYKLHQIKNSLFRLIGSRMAIMLNKLFHQSLR